jgi:sterol desaturase/sphingolipid hydroxylase (fatty acid hydroxylase superfamily)
MIYLKNYVLVNGLLWLGGIVSYMTYMSAPFPLTLVGLTYAKQWILVTLIATSTRHIPYSRGSAEMRDSTHDMFYLAKISLFDSLVLALLLHQTVERGLMDEIVWFIPKSFVYEILFDFFHYWNHRFIHSSSILYTFIHAQHHAQIYIDPYKAMYQSFADLALTNCLPLYLASVCIPVSPFFLFVFFWYKAFIEISGHIGKPIRATCFPQCMVLPRMLGIALYAQDHEYHHVRPTTNFAKRFALWDIVFQTYVAGRAYVEER